MGLRKKFVDSEAKDPYFLSQTESRTITPTRFELDETRNDFPDDIY